MSRFLMINHYKISLPLDKEGEDHVEEPDGVDRPGSGHDGEVGLHRYPGVDTEY